MKTVTFLTRAIGEYSTTERSIEGVYTDDMDIDFEKEHLCIRNSDDWTPCSKKLYELKDVEIPEWMEASKFNPLLWMQYTRIGGNEDLGENAYNELTEFMYSNERLVEACLTILKVKNFRSDFRKSLRTQIDDYLVGKSEYSTPLTQRQVDCVLPNYYR